MRDPYTKEDYKEMMRMLANGKSLRDVGKHFQLSSTSVYNKLIKLGTSLGANNIKELLQIAKTKGVVDKIVCKSCGQEVRQNEHAS